MLSECFMAQMTVKWYDFIYVNMFILLYVAFIVLLRITVGIDWPYPFFEVLDHFDSMILYIIGVIMLGLGFILLKGFIRANNIWKKETEEEQRLNEQTQ